MCLRVVSAVCRDMMRFGVVEWAIDVFWETVDSIGLLEESDGHSSNAPPSQACGDHYLENVVLRTF